MSDSLRSFHLCACVLLFGTTTVFGAGQTHHARPKHAEHVDKAVPVEEDPPVKSVPPNKEHHPVAVSTMATGELVGFEEYPAQVQKIIIRALELTTLNLGYQFGSSDPKAGGMDCSGAVYRVLQDSGVKDAPRQSDEICQWIMDRDTLYRTEFPLSFSTPTFSALKPGDLVFWSGTYETSVPRELPITHVMIYLGKRKTDNKPILFGASDGRSFDGQRKNGVSVFDFHIPKPGDKSAIYGYGHVPELLKTKPAR